MGKKFDGIILLDDDVRGKVHKLIERGLLKLYGYFLADSDSYGASVIAYVGTGLMEGADVFTGEPKRLDLTLPVPTAKSFPAQIAAALLRQLNAEGKKILLLCDQTWSFKEADRVRDRDDLSGSILDAFRVARAENEYKKIVAVFYSSLSNHKNILPKGDDAIDVVQDTVVDWRWEDILSSLRRIDKVLAGDERQCRDM